MKHISILLGSALIMYVLSSCGESKAENGDVAGQSLQVEGFLVEPEEFNATFRTTASLMADEQVELMAPMAGQVLEIHFKEGQQISKGSAIVRLDDRGWRAQLIGVNAALDAATTDLARKEDLLGIAGSSQAEVDNALSQVESLRSQQKQLQVNIDLANVKAPFSGRLGMRDFSTGAFLNQGDVITSLTSTSKIKVEFTISQMHANKVSSGQKLDVLIGKDTLSAEIYAISPVIDANSRTLQVRAIMEQVAGQEVLPGTFAEVSIGTEHLSSAILIPTQAVVPSINEQTVYILDHGKALRKTIEMGERTADKVRILSGISIGDTVITTGMLSIKDGLPLTIQTVHSSAQ